MKYCLRFTCERVTVIISVAVSSVGQRKENTAAALFRRGVPFDRRCRRPRVRAWIGGSDVSVVQMRLTKCGPRSVYEYCTKYEYSAMIPIRYWQFQTTRRRSRTLTAVGVIHNLNAKRRTLRVSVTNTPISNGFTPSPVTVFVYVHGIPVFVIRVVL